LFEWVDVERCDNVHVALDETAVPGKGLPHVTHTDQDNIVILVPVENVFHNMENFGARPLIIWWR
jgi:hypothetical protein